MRQKAGEFEHRLGELSGQTLTEVAEKLGIKNKEYLKKRIESLSNGDISVVDGRVVYAASPESRPKSTQSSFGARNLQLGQDYLDRCDLRLEETNRLTGAEVARLMSIETNPPRKRV